VVRANDLPPFKDRLPYVAALVDLDEGPRLMTNVIDCDPDALLIGQQLTVAWRDDPETGVVVPVFRPVS
jgi:uncharacterized OB-fold protein